MPRTPVARRIAVLQHVAFEGPGAIADWAESRGHDLARVALYRGAAVPEPQSVDAVVAMGGPMGVDDGDRFPFLHQEKRLLLSCVEAGRPVLGVCLGAQLLAGAVGARVSTQGYREIGWFPLRWHESARAVPTFAHVPAETIVFHWHGDTFALPVGTVPLAASEACPNQGFSSPDGRMVGLQFHLEMRGEDVREILLHGRNELAPGGRFVQAEEEILAGHARHGAPLRPLLDTLLDRWIATAV